MSGRIATLKRIVKDRQAEKIDGVLVDVITAHALLTCWEAGNDNTKKQIATADIRGVAAVALRICKPVRRA